MRSETAETLRPAHKQGVSTEGGVKPLKPFQPEHRTGGCHHFELKYILLKLNIVLKMKLEPIKWRYPHLIDYCW